MEVVLSGETRYDDYGNFWFKDKEGKERKIGTKREDFEELCTRVENNPNRAVTLKFDHYMNKPYIVGVELLDKQIQVDEAKITEQQKEPMVVETTPIKPTIAPQAIGMTTKELGDMIRANKLREIFGLEASVELVKWYRGQILGTTGIPFDGSKLPSFKKED